MIVIYADCPHCGAKVKTESELDTIFMARRTCEACRGEILIVNNKPMKPEDYKPAA